MNEIKLKDFLELEPNLFEAINTIRPFPFLTGKTEELELILKAFHGLKTVFDSVVDWDIQTIAKVLVLEHGNKWDDYIKIAALSENVNNRRELEETTNQIEERLNTRDDVNKVSAFNSDSMLDDGGVAVSGKDDLTGDTTRILKDENINVKHSYNMLNLANKESIINKVVGDVARSLTLSIY